MGISFGISLLLFYLGCGMLIHRMNHLLALLITHLEVILRHGGYWVILVVSIVEALPLIGTVLLSLNVSFGASTSAWLNCFIISSFI